MAQERLQKILARAGVGSRRAAERLIAEGRVRVNARIVTELGTKADTQHDRVELDGKRVVAEHPVYYLLHKPREVVATLSDPEGRESVADLMKRVPERVFPVGRLDYHTSGALLMTNDGEMAQALLHPRKLVPKVYIAKLKGALSLAHLQALREGVVLDGGEKTRKAEVLVDREEHGNTWLRITITEGKNRQIHRMADAIGRRVMRLFRLTFAELSIDGLRPGQHRPLTDGEVAKLKRDYLSKSKRDKQEQARARRRDALDGAGAEAQVDAAEVDAAAPAARAANRRRAGPRAPRSGAARSRPLPTPSAPKPRKAPYPSRGRRRKAASPRKQTPFDPG